MIACLIDNSHLINIIIGMLSSTLLKFMQRIHKYVIMVLKELGAQRFGVVRPLKLRYKSDSTYIFILAMLLTVLLECLKIK